MKIPFRKIGTTPQAFTVTQGSAVLNGTLNAYKRNLIQLEGHLTGTMELECDRCAENYDTILDEKLSFLLSDGIFHGNDEDYDVIEVLDETIDLDEILNSELELQRCDYHHCPSCSSTTL